MTTPTSPSVPVPRNGGSPPLSLDGAAMVLDGFAARPPGVPAVRSSYLDYLPGVYHENDFMARFLLIFEHILSPIERTVANSSEYIDPGTTPDDFLPWLGSWL